MYMNSANQADSDKAPFSTQKLCRAYTVQYTYCIAFKTLLLHTLEPQANESTLLASINN